MKKVKGVILFLILALSLVACQPAAEIEDLNEQTQIIEENVIKAYNLHGDSFLIVEDFSEMLGLGQLLVIRSELESYQAGSVYKIELEPEIATSYPGQARAKTIELLEDVSLAPINLEIAENIMIHLPETYLLDVRTAEEFSAGHVPNSISLPLDSIEKEAENKISSKDDLIIVYCASGNRSKTATTLFKDLGYNNVLDAGGINQYEGELEF